MKFDKLCNIIINEAKSKGDKYANLIIGNANPIITIEDVLKDPTDPSRGLKLYLAPGKVERTAGRVAYIDENNARAAVRRVNWIIKQTVRKYKNSSTGLSVDRLWSYITMLLEKYQTRVWNKNVDKANTTYETRIIGNLLLPPTTKEPRGKSVWMAPGMDPNATVEQQHKPVVSVVNVKQRDPETKKVTTVQVKKAPVTAVDLVAEFEKQAEYYIALMDLDLQRTIKKIVDEGEQGATAEPPPAESEIGEYDPEDEPQEPEDTAEGLNEAVTLRDILNDPRIKDVYDPKVVKDAVKGYIEIGVLKQNVDGTIIIGPEEEKLATKIRSRANAPSDLPEISDVEPDDAELKAIEREPEIEDEEEVDPEQMAGIAKHNLGYTHGRDEEEEEEGSEEEEVSGPETW